MNWAHWHMILVHFPVAGCIFALAALIGIRFTKNIAVQKLAFVFIVLVAATAFPAAITGGPSQEQLAPIPTEMQHYIDRHAMISLFATWALQLSGFLAIVSLGWLYRVQRIPATLSWINLGALLVASYLMAWCASLGGEVVHQEIRGHKILPAIDLDLGETLE